MVNTTGANNVPPGSLSNIVRTSNAINGTGANGLQTTCLPSIEGGAGHPQRTTVFDVQGGHRLTYRIANLTLVNLRIVAICRWQGVGAGGQT